MKPQARIVYDAMMRGEVLTNQTSKQLYGVEALSQRCGEITRDSSVPEVVSSKRVHGKPYNVHWIQGAVKSANVEKPPVVVSSYVRHPIAKATTDNQLVMYFGAC